MCERGILEYEREGGMAYKYWVSGKLVDTVVG